MGGRLFDDLLSDAVPDGRLRAAEHALERAVIGAGQPAQDSPKGYDPSQLAWASMFRPGAAQRVAQLLSDLGFGSTPPATTHGPPVVKLATKSRAPASTRLPFALAEASATTPAAIRTASGRNSDDSLGTASSSASSAAGDPGGASSEDSSSRAASASRQRSEQ